MLSRRRACWVLLATLAPLGTALSQGAPASTPGYDVERSQSVQTAPAGSVGRKTTDREHRVGNAAAMSAPPKHLALDAPSVDNDSQDAGDQL